MAIVPNGTTNLESDPLVSPYPSLICFPDNFKSFLARGPMSIHRQTLQESSLIRSQNSCSLCDLRGASEWRDAIGLPLLQEWSCSQQTISMQFCSSANTTDAVGSTRSQIIPAPLEYRTGTRDTVPCSAASRLCAPFLRLLLLHFLDVLFSLVFLFLLLFLSHHRRLP